MTTTKLTLDEIYKLAYKALSKMDAMNITQKQYQQQFVMQKEMEVYHTVCLEFRDM